MRTALIVLFAVLGAACGIRVGSPFGATEEVACSVVGTIRFPISYLKGPDYSRPEFAATEIGGSFESFFVGGEGEPENQQYLDSDGFSVVSRSLVLGYRGDLPVAYFMLNGDEVGGWGGCRPIRVAGSLVAYRWQPVQPIDPAASIVPIQVEGGGCVTDSRTEVTTEVKSVEVLENSDRVEITVWVRERLPLAGCAGVGVMVDANAELSGPLGSRTLVDAGTIPPTPHPDK